jgi:hypothetical protein
LKILLERDLFVYKSEKRYRKREKVSRAGESKFSKRERERQRINFCTQFYDKHPRKENILILCLTTIRRGLEAGRERVNSL